MSMTVAIRALMTSLPVKLSGVSSLLLSVVSDLREIKTSLKESQ